MVRFGLLVNGGAEGGSDLFSIDLIVHIVPFFPSLQCLLKRRAPLQEDLHGVTPTVYATLEGRTAVVRYLRVCFERACVRVRLDERHEYNSACRAATTLASTTQIHALSVGHTHTHTHT